MSQERTEAIVLRGVDFSETSRIVTFLTPDRGRFACMAAGARRAKSALGPVLDTFNRLEIVHYWRDGRSVQKLGEASLLDGFVPLKADLDKSMWAAFPLELVDRTAQENEPSQGLYKTLVSGLESMTSWSGSAKVHAAWQAAQLLVEAGFAPGLTADAEVPGPAQTIGFSYDHGTVGSGEPADRRMTRQGYETLCALVTEREACPAIANADEAFDALRHYATRQIEADFRSLRVLDQVMR